MYEEDEYYEDDQSEGKKETDKSEDLLDNDEISAEEEAFMKGYEEASEEDEDKEDKEDKE